MSDWYNATPLRKAVIVGVWCVTVILVLFLLVGSVLFVNYKVLPSWRLSRAETEKRILVEQARAERDSAVFEAEGEVNRAKGVAEANRIIAASITEEYLRYHYINTLAKNQHDVIYVPTEAGLPILEAGKR